ncbi:MAG: anthranilate synthase component I family protein [Bacteroidetes bacterium]|nr:anthranilate synthase component I family protein [Bacteroidota bacterium]
MRNFYPLAVEDEKEFKAQLLELSKFISPFCSLESNNYPNYPHAHFGSMIAIGSIEEFNPRPNLLDEWGNFQRKAKDWIFGYFSYDIKNQIEPSLSSNNIDELEFPDCHFFVPKYLISFFNGSVSIGVRNQDDLVQFESLLKKTKQVKKEEKRSASFNMKSRISKADYIKKVEGLKDHILNGDIYEINYCMELFAKNVDINPISVYEHLCEISKAPFGVFYNNNEHFLSCSSPERFLKRDNNKLISQPIKGTIKRGINTTEDILLKNKLSNDEKEKTENVMIVDLVRNDLAKISKKNTVKVEELCNIYTFETVHQMISTITSEIEKDIPIESIFKATFPMGSMTGAPKLNAMKFSELYEISKRGLYSGTVGYITPQGNFDFNVVIRSILYNQKKGYLSIQVGSAITFNSNPESEYAECLLKAKGLLKALEVEIE